MKNLVLLGSGWTNVGIAWRPFRQKLAKEGFDSIICTYQGRGFGDIRHSAQNLADLLDAVAPFYDHITFIGHSMGGIVGRYVLQKMDQGKHIDSFVSLGSPHSGTLLAYLAPWSRSACQMQIGSKFLFDLNTTPWPDIPTLNVLGSFETIVIPTNSALLDWGETIIIPRATHFSLVFSQRTIYEVLAWLMMEVLGVDFQKVGRGVSSKIS